MASSSVSNPQIETGGEQDHLSHYLRLYKDILCINLDDIKLIWAQDPNMLEARITENGDTPLHVAVSTGYVKDHHVMEYLVIKMSHDQLSLRNNDGDTALSTAAMVGNLRAAKKIVKKHESLTQIANNDRMVPIMEAARHAHKDMVLYLLPYSEDLLTADIRTGVLFLNFLITARFFNIALKLVLKRNPSLATVEFDGGGSLLCLIANDPSSFPSGRHVRLYENPFCDILAHWKDERNNARKYKQAQDLLEFVCQKITRTQDYAKASALFKQPLLSAARLGISEVVREIVKSFPHAVRFTNFDNHNIFHLAVLNRWKNILHLIYEMGDYNYRLLLLPVDSSGNNILHLAAKLGPPDRLSVTSCGAAFQMQSEIQWYKEVESLVPPSFKEEKNSEGKTPAMLFTESHRDLVKEGEKWMKDAASSCSLVGVLVASIVFAAAITVPGGNDEKKGYPHFIDNETFKTFSIFDALSILSAMSSILTFLSILTAKHSESDFQFILPQRFVFGMYTLVFSISAMMSASACTILLVFFKDKSWAMLPLRLLAGWPIYLFGNFQYPIISSMRENTYWPTNICRKKKRILRLFVKGNDAKRCSLCP